MSRGWETWRWLGHLATGALVLLLVAACTDGQDEQMTRPEVVRLAIGAAPETIENHDWPREGDGEPRFASVIDRPVEIDADLGGGAGLVSPSFATTVHQREGRIVNLTVRPISEYQQLPDAIDSMRSLLRDNELLTNRLAQQLDDWAAQDRDGSSWPEAGELLGVREQLREDLVLVLQLHERAGAGWFATLETGLPAEMWN